MRNELETRLQDEFEFMRPSTNESNTSAYVKYECEVLDGWFDLLYSMCSEIQALKCKFVPVQIKQKYSRLRVYYRSNDPRVDEIIEKYEKMSETICEECGKPGVYRREHMAIILCDECYEVSNKAGSSPKFIE